MAVMLFHVEANHEILVLCSDILLILFCFLYSFFQLPLLFVAHMYERGFYVFKMS